MNEKILRRVVSLWVEGKELAEIRKIIASEFGEEISEEQLLSLLPSSGEVEEGPKSPEEVINWLYEWQLERLKRYKELERKMNLPIPDVKSNIALMLQILERLRPREVDLVRDIFEVE